MVHIIVKRTDRELRERATEAPARYRAAGLTRYARDPEEAYDVVRREHGLDNPNHPQILCDDSGKADKQMRDRALRAAGRDPGEFE